MAGSVLVVIALLLLTDSLSATDVPEDADSESTSTSTVRTPVGGTAYLRCHLPNTGPHDNVYWARQHPDNALVIHKKFVPVLSGRLDSSCSSHSKECLLIINHVVKDDSGLYYCGVNNREPPIQRSVYLSVYEPVAKILGEPFRAHWQGSQMNLTCIVQPPPATGIEWMHGDSVMSPVHDTRLSITFGPSTSTISYLLLEDIQPEDAGTYTCKLRSGSSDSVDVDVMQVVRDDFYPTMSGARQPLAAVPVVGSVILSAAATAFASHRC